MKSILALCAFCLFFQVQSESCSAQNNVKASTLIDSTPIEDLDYHLSKDAFMYYYGTDDTSRAIIHLFYRKRGIAALDFIVMPIAASVLGNLMETFIGNPAIIIVGTVIATVGFWGIPIYYIVQRSNYNRQKLIYVLVGRERGERVPFNILDKLRDQDFQ